MKTLTACILLLALSGCVLAPQKARTINSDIFGDNREMITIPANLRTVDIRKTKSGYIVCSEPMPDVAMSNVLKLAVEASQAQEASASSVTGEDSVSSSLSNTTGIKGNSEAATTALQLAGRTQVVLLAREFLYRNCVARANNWIDDPAFKESQNKIIDQISNMIDADKARADADIARAKAMEAAAKAVPDKKALQNVTRAIQDAKIEFCINEYDSCVLKAAGDDKKLKACRAELTKCNN